MLKSDSCRAKTRAIYSEWFPIFNPLKASEETIGIPQPKGQVLYFAGQERNKYPLATFDAIRDTASTDAAIQRYEESNTNKGFHGATIFRYPGEFESETQKSQMIEQVAKMMGPDSPGVTIAQIDEDFSGTLMEQIPAGSDDALFSLTLASILERTLYHYNIPPALFGVAPSGGVFTQLAYQESFVVYNVITRNVRNSVSRVFNKLSALWHEQPFEFGRILENEFEVQEESNQRIANEGFTNEEIADQAEDVTDPIPEVLKPGATDADPIPDVLKPGPTNGVAAG